MEPEQVKITPMPGQGIYLVDVGERHIAYAGYSMLEVLGMEKQKKD
jgi:hypothetical protein